MKGRKDVVGAAETGSGKTLAFGIPMIYGIMKDKEFELKKKNNNLGLMDNEDEGEEDDQTEDKVSEQQSDESEDEQNEENTEDPEDPEESVEVPGHKKQFENVIDVADMDFAPIKVTKDQKKLRGLIITPTRELAVQIEKHLKAVAKYTDVTMALVIGGMAAPKQERLLSKGPDIVIGTPGRLWELIESGNAHLSQVGDIR